MKRLDQLLLNMLLIAVIALPGMSFANDCDDLPKENNRGIGKVAFKRSTSGDVLLQVKPYLSIRESKDDGVNLSFDVKVSVNGKLFGFASEDVLAGGAITCAETCAGDCPSIFGDGVCASCNCDYGDWITIPLPPGIIDGDLVEIQIVAARGGERDRDTNDDIRRVKYYSSLIQ